MLHCIGSRKKQKIDNDSQDSTDSLDLEDGEIFEAVPLWDLVSPTSSNTDQTALSSTHGSVPSGKSCSCGHESCDECGVSILVSPSSTERKAADTGTTSETGMLLVIVMCFMFRHPYQRGSNVLSLHNLI